MRKLIKNFGLLLFMGCVFTKAPVEAQEIQNLMGSEQSVDVKTIYGVSAVDLCKRIFDKEYIEKIPFSKLSCCKADVVSVINQHNISQAEDDVKSLNQGLHVEYIGNRVMEFYSSNSNSGLFYTRYISYELQNISKDSVTLLHKIALIPLKGEFGTELSFVPNYIYMSAKYLAPINSFDDDGISSCHACYSGFHGRELLMTSKEYQYEQQREIIERIIPTELKNLANLKCFKKKDYSYMILKDCLIEKKISELSMKYFEYSKSNFFLDVSSLKWDRIFYRVGVNYADNAVISAIYGVTYDGGGCGKWGAIETNFMQLSYDEPRKNPRLRKQDLLIYDKKDVQQVAFVQKAEKEADCYDKQSEEQVAFVQKVAKEADSEIQINNARKEKTTCGC